LMRLRLQLGKLYGMAPRGAESTTILVTVE
jgi:hypothetical protein